MSIDHLSIQYSTDNESIEAEANEVKVKAGGKTMVITASGGRVFPYILKRPKVIYAVDINPAQQFLFLLKLEGIRRLEYSEFLELVGVYDDNDCWGCTRGNNCWQRYQQIRDYLPKDAREYFDCNPKVIQRGPLYAGRLERLFRKFALFVHIWRPKKCKKLFSFTNLDEQKIFVQEEWDTLAWRIICKWLLLNPFLLRIISGDSALGKYNTTDCPVGKTIYERLMCALQHQLVRENHVITFLFLHRYENGTVLPVYLQREGFKALKDTIPEISIRICTGDISEICRSLPESSLDNISMSDVGDYMSSDMFVEYIKEAARTLRRGGVLCWKYYLSNYTLPQEIMRKFVHNLEAEEKIARSERFYITHVLEKK